MSITVFVSVDTDKAREYLRVKERDIPHILETTGREIARGMRNDYRQTVASWQKKPTFTEIVDVRPGQGVDVLVGTDNPIYTMLDRGTQAHFIFPKKPGGRLAFAWDGPGSYGAKTTPGSLKSGPARYPSTKVVRRWVLHPGTEARGWSVIIDNKWQKQGPEVLRKYLERWARE